MTRLPQGVSVGLGLFTGQSPDPGGAPTLDQLPSLAQAAEEAGFDAFWASEHHAFPDAYLPSPLTALAAAAAVTDRILLGTGLVIAPLHHPVRLAEDSAVVDVLSHGRLILGLGIGYADHEFRMFDTDRRGRGKRLEELVTFLRAAWAGEPVTPPGQLEPIRITPRPYGRIPIWLGGYAPAALGRAARLGDGHLIGRGDLPIIKDSVAGLRHHPPDPRAFTIGVNLLTVLDGPRLDGASARRRFLRHQQSYEDVQQLDDPYSGATGRPASDSSSPASAANYLHAAGHADAVVEDVRRHLGALGDWPHVHVVLRALFPDDDADAQLRRIDGLGREVVPRLREPRTR